MTLYHAHIIDTPTPKAFSYHPNAYIQVNEQGVVENIYDALPASLANEPIVDFGNQLLIPAFCDMHVHAPQFRNMGLAMDLPLIPWLNTYTFPEEAKFAQTDYAATVYDLFVRSLVKHGSLHSSVFATVHLPATRILADTLGKYGVKSFVGLVAMDRNCPDELQHSPQDTLQAIIDLDAYLQAYPQLHSIITPRFIPSCTPAMLTQLGQLAKQTNMPVQSHLSENKKEIEWVRELEPDSQHYGDAYYRYGLFGQTPTLMAHCNYSAGKELEMMQAQHIAVVHCPTSNMNISSGLAPIRTFLEAGVEVCLGSDVSGGHDMSMLHVMQYAIQTSKIHQILSDGKLSPLSLSEVFYMATKAGSKLFGSVGSFEPGYAFDALVIDDSELNTMNYSLQHRLERFIYVGDDRHIRHRFCQGKEICFN